MHGLRPPADEGSRERARARLAAHRWPAAWLEVLARLRDGGHEAWLVGGTVRDVLLGRERAGAAADVATDRRPDEVGALFERVEPVGAEHGTMLVLHGGERLEVTTFRLEDDYADARHPGRVTFTRDLGADLARRDLTVNALAWDPHAGTLVDPHGGLADLARGTLRAVGDPVERFHEDGLRPLRVARLAAELGMEPEPATRAALGRVHDRAAKVALERVRVELERLMEAPRPSVGLELLRESGLLPLWLPELAACVGVAQNRHHAHDVYRHTLAVCDAAPADRPRVRWAALFHDVGKPLTRVERAGEGTFYGHEAASADLADGALARLRFPAETRRAIVHLVREHMFDGSPGWSDAALRRWVRRVGVEALDDLLELRAADAAGKTAGAPADAALAELRARLARLLDARPALSVADLAVDGEDVMRALGTGPGPAVGHALEALLEAVIEDPARNTREALLARLAATRADAVGRPPQS